MSGSADSLPGRQRATIVALFVVAIVAVFQSAIIFLIVGAQRDAAHIIDISGAQRARSQQLAFFASEIASGRATVGTTAKIDRIIAETAAVRSELTRRPMFVSGPRDRNGQTAIGRLSASYISEIRTLEHRPSDRRAFAAIRRDRPLLLAAYDAAVKTRVAVVVDRNDRLVAALAIGLVLQIACIAGVWRWIVFPAERLGRKLFAEVRDAREQIESTFAANPDGIAIYDRDGCLVRMNASRAAFAGYSPESVVGRHICDLVDAKDAGKAQIAFDRVMKGETVRSDVELVRPDGRTVIIAITMFPRIIDGVPAGVNVVSKDISSLRAAEALNTEQMRRLSDLYDLASAYDLSTEQLLTSALELVASRLGYDYGVSTEIEGDAVKIVSISGGPLGLVVGSVQPLEGSFSRLALDAPDAFEARDFFETPYATAATRAAGWRSVCGMKILVGGVVYGTIGFASRQRRSVDLSSADVGFMRLASALIGTFIERGRQLRRLDALAFYDSLTGLPNREQFRKRLDDSILRESSFALYYVDLDRFKLVNDRFGHGAGDAVLKATAQRLLSCVRNGDMVVRLSGDEFAIVQNGPVDVQRVARLAERVVGAFGEPLELHCVLHDVGVSVGVAIYPTHAGDARSLVEAADKALYRAKRAGRGGYVVADVRRSIA